MPVNLKDLLNCEANPEDLKMSTREFMSRRRFVTGTSGLLLSSTGRGLSKKNAATASSDSRLALEGGAKAVQKAPSRTPRWGEPERERLEAMLSQRSLFYWNGPQTRLLIQRFREVCPLEYVHSCSSGTAALHIAVAASGVGPGDEVITSPVTDIGSVIGLIYQQAVPVFADLDPGSYNLDVADVERRITSKTKAIIAVHIAGNPCDMEPMRALADRRSLILIEDCAQAWGARYRGQPIGTIGDFACFSLQDSKQVTCGDGGVVACRHERFGTLLQRFGDKGNDRVQRDGFQVFATNYRMSEPQAAVAAAQMERVESIAARRGRLGRILSENLDPVPGLRAHQVHPEDRSVFYFYMFRWQPQAFRCSRAQFVKALVAEGVRATAGYIKVPLYGEPVFRKHGFFAGRWPIRELGLTDMDYSKHSCPEAEKILETGIRLPIHEGMAEQDIQAISAAVRKVAHHYAV